MFDGVFDNLISVNALPQHASDLRCDREDLGDTGASFDPAEVAFRAPFLSEKRRVAFGVIDCLLEIWPVGKDDFD
jgi:hypothetical protein